MSELVELQHELASITRSALDGTNRGIWEHEPVGFRTFVESPDYLAHPPNSEEQYLHVERFIGNDPKALFMEAVVDITDLKEVDELGESATTAEYIVPDVEDLRSQEESFYLDSKDIAKVIAVFLWGKGGGKDTIASQVQAYVVYLLLCMRNPQEYFKMPPGENIDCINVSTSGQQAKMVFFSKLKAKILNSTWFTANFKISVEGRVFNPVRRRGDTRPEIKIKADLIEFPKGIRAISSTSVNESQEGYNPIFWVMDEASGFKNNANLANADKIYNTLCTSARSRFGSCWRGMIISYPRADNDFTIRTYEQGLSSPHIYSCLRYTWEVRPSRFYRGDTFEFEGVQVPVELYDDFLKKPRLAKQMYMCHPLPSEGVWIEDDSKILQCIDRGRAPLFRVADVLLQQELQDNTLKTYIGKQLLDPVVSNELKKMTFAAHVDLGQKQDSAALALAHSLMVQVKTLNENGDEVMKDMPMVVFDLLAEWRPVPEKKLDVSIINVTDFLLALHELLGIRVASYDQWNSAESLERLNRAMLTDQHNINVEDYYQFESSMNMGLVRFLDPETCPPQEKALYELRHLVRVNQKIDHPQDGSKDVIDAMVGAARLLISAPEKISKYVHRNAFPAMTRIGASEIGKAGDAFLNLTPAAQTPGQVQIVPQGPGGGMSGIEQLISGPTGAGLPRAPMIQPGVPPMKFPKMR